MQFYWPSVPTAFRLSLFPLGLCVFASRHLNVLQIVSLALSAVILRFLARFEGVCVL